jgi:hypothetical protein
MTAVVGCTGRAFESTATRPKEKSMLGKKCSTKEAVMVLEAGEITRHTGHDIDPRATLITAAIAMRRSEWWHTVPYTGGGDRWRGWVKGPGINCEVENEYSGEIPWR